MFVWATQEAFQASIDERFILGAKLLVAEAELVECSGSKILDKHVRILNEPKRECLSSGRLHIKANTALVAVIHGEVASTRTRQPSGVVSTNRLDLKYIGTEVGKHKSRGWPHDHVRKLDDSDSSERLGGVHSRGVSITSIRRNDISSCLIAPTSRRMLHAIKDTSTWTASHSASGVDVLISEVGMRDGLQSLASIMPTEAKKAWIRMEAEAGVAELEVGFLCPQEPIAAARGHSGAGGLREGNRRALCGGAGSKFEGCRGCRKKRCPSHHASIFSKREP